MEIAVAVDYVVFPLESSDQMILVQVLVLLVEQVVHHLMSVIVVVYDVSVVDL
jgi:hypothetical protein